MEIQAKITKHSDVVGEIAEKVKSTESIAGLLSALISAKQKTNDILTQLVNADKLDPNSSSKYPVEDTTQGAQ